MIKQFRPLKNQVFITDLERGMRKTAGGIILPNDNMTDQGIRQRWGKVAFVGPDVTDVEVGEWILLPHGRWTNRIAMEIDGEKIDVWMVDSPAILLVSDSRPEGVDEVLGTAPSFA